MVTLVNPPSVSDSFKNMENSPRVAWLLQGARAYWQPILSEFTHLLPETKVFTADWAGFIPGFEDSFTVEHVGPKKIIRFPGKSSGYSRSLTYLPPRVVKPLIEYRPQVIFTTGFSFWTLLVCLLKVVYHWRVVIVYDGSSPGVDYQGSPLRSFQRRCLVRLTDAFITNNQAGKRYISEFLKVPTERVFARPYLLPDPKAYESSLGIAKHLREKQCPIFVFVGNIIPRKGIQELLKACASLKKRGHEQFTLVIVGDGSERSRLEAYVHNHGLSTQVIWVGAVKYEQVGAYLDIADVFVFPTREDVWGLVLVESMLFGKPVIASKWAGATELVVDKENGYIFDPYHPEQLSELMASFIEHPAKIEQMGEKSKKIMDNHKMEKVTKSLSDIVYFLLEKSYFHPS